MLTMTKTKLELITDPDMYILFEKAARGGISAKPATNIKKCYDPKQATKHIIYLDTNNLCGYAMSKFLPTSRFK